MRQFQLSLDLPEALAGGGRNATAMEDAQVLIALEVGIRQACEAALATRDP